MIISDDAVVSDSVTIDADKGATVSGRAHMSDHATLFEQAQISGRATISDDALLSGQSMVSGQAHVGDSAHISGVAFIAGNAHISGHSVIRGRAHISDSAVIIDHANITLPQHILTVAPLGPTHASATLFRTADGHCLVIGSWHGTVDQLAEYGMNPQELQGLTTIVAARIKAWSP